MGDLIGVKELVLKYMYIPTNLKSGLTWIATRRWKLSGLFILVDKLFLLELIYYFTYFSTVVPSSSWIFLSCRPFIINMTFSTGLVPSLCHIEHITVSADEEVCEVGERASVLGLDGIHEAVFAVWSVRGRSFG